MAARSSPTARKTRSCRRWPEERSMSQNVKQITMPDAPPAVVDSDKPALKEILSALNPANVAKSLAREEDLDFMSETSAAAMQGPPVVTHWIVWGAVAFIIAFIVWAAYANIGETTVGDGKVIPSSQTQVIQNLE